MMRLQKYIAACGVCSRRAAEEMIKEGRVTVNGETASLGVSVCETDRVLIDGAEISLTVDKLYILLFKPVGVVTTAKDERGRKTVLDLLNIEERVYPVGRLDINTSGLLLLTNDGDLANRLTHPKFNVDKTYKAVVEGEITSAKLKELENGIVLEDG
ncbi:MAG: rRNA pseudouridine synthase, partial [Clostridia bacterium]|nr:rRNA pseudouridine synthase [Clostridia bacterium]